MSILALAAGLLYVAGVALIAIHYTLYRHMVDTTTWLVAAVAACWPVLFSYTIAQKATASG